MAKGFLRIGTSGWHYMTWRGPFYPQNMRAGDFLPYYAARFATAEINNSFYQMPKPETLEAWRDTVPDDFVFAVKASRFTTHMKKLKDPASTCLPFLERIAHLGDRLGPIVFQLPPRWRYDADRLGGFLSALPPGIRYAFELRDPSWLVDDAYGQLRDAGAAFCVYDYAGRQSPLVVTADFVYIRLHGPSERPYHGAYGAELLRPWARHIERWCSEGLDVYCYFDNDVGGHAPHDAHTLSRLLASGACAGAHLVTRGGM